MRYLKFIRVTPTIATLSVVALLVIACGGVQTPSGGESATASSPANRTTNQVQPPSATTAPSSHRTTSEPTSAEARATQAPTTQRSPADANALMAATGPPGAPSPRGVAGQIQATTASQGGPIIPPESGGTDNPNDGAFPLTYFEHYGVNPFMEPDEDPLSTFALDGDTASYEILKLYLRNGHLAEPDSVRVEEYINSLPQNYPPSETALGLHLDAGPSPFGEPGYVLLRVGVSNPAPTTDRDPVSLIFVVDVSGSMQADNRLGLAKEVIEGIADQMIPSDRAAIVTYADSVVVAHHFTDGEDTRDIVSAVRKMRAGGSTFAEAGLRLAYDLASDEMDDGRKARLVLLSDGVANVGATGPESILKIVDEYAQRNATLTTIGVGASGNYNDVLLEVLANRGNGTYHYMSDRNAAERFLQESVPGVFSETARDARVQVEFYPDVVRKYRLIGYENRAVADEDFRDDSLDFGEVGFARDVSALYELRLQDDVASDSVLATARLRWLDPQTREATELSADIRFGETATDLSATDPYFRQTAAAAEFAELLRGSVWAQCNNLDAVTGLLDTVESDLDENQTYRELRGLVERADNYFEPTCQK